MKCIGSPLCTYRVNWARRTSWGWWDEWDDTVLQTQDSKIEPWRSEAEQRRARYLSVTKAPHNTDFHTWMGKKICLFFSNRRDREPSPELWRERQTRHINPMLVQRWPTVCDAGPILYQHRVNVTCLLCEKSGCNFSAWYITNNNIITDTNRSISLMLFQIRDSGPMLGQSWVSVA